MFFISYNLMFEEEHQIADCYTSYVSVYKEENLDNRIVDISYLTKEFKGFSFTEGGYYHSQTIELAGFFCHAILWFTDPIFDGKTKTVSYYSDLSKRERDIRTTSKIGKYLRKIGNYYSDKQIEMLVNAILNSIVDISEYEYKVGKTKEDFAKVYCTKPEPSNGRLGNYSCINASCMYKPHRWDEETHPVQVYGSGDFEIHYLTRNGKIAARVIVGAGYHNYIYTCNSKVGQYLEEILNEQDITEGREENFYGLRLLMIKDQDYGANYYLTPYLDTFSYVKHEDGYFVVCYERESDASFNTTAGRSFVRIKKYYTCCGCGEKTSNYEEVGSETYCMSCLSYCDDSAEYTTESVFEVFYGPHWYTYRSVRESLLHNYHYDGNKYYTNEYYEQMKKEQESE